MANPAVVFDAKLRFNEREITRNVQKVQNLVNKSTIPNLNTRGITEPLGQISKSAGEFEKSLAASNARVLAFGASVGIIAGVQQAFKALVTETINVEKALADINVILNETDKGLSRFSSELFNIAKNTGQSFKTAADAATEFARQGLGAEETLRRVNDSLILVRLSGIDATRAVEGLTAVVNGFAKEALNTTEIINTLANVDAAFAVSTSDLVEALARVGSTAQSAGVGFNELISIVTAAQQITARGGAVIGNSLKTIFTRLQRSSTLDALEELGIATQNANGGFRDGISLLSDLATSYDGLQDSQKAYVSELVGGVFQINVLKALLGDLGREVSIYEGALGVANRTTDEAIRRNERLNQTIAASVNEVSNSISQLLSQIGNIGAADPIRNIIGIVDSMATSMNDLLGEETGSKIAQGFVKGFGAILGGPAFISAVIIASKLFVSTAGFAAKSLKTILGVASETEKVRNLQIGINQALYEAGTSYSAIVAGSKNVAQAEAKVLEILKQQNAVRKGTVGINVAAPLAQRGVRFQRETGIFKNLASGSELTPTIMKEVRSIEQGVGGASRSAKPVVVPNFNFGRGKKGTVVANTDELIVPNFGGSGGDAIFNQTMIRKMGVPQGAQKLAAKGLVPNFAFPPYEVRPGEITRSDFLDWYHKLSDQDIFGLEFEKKDGTIRKSSYKRSFNVKSLVRKGADRKFYSKDIPFDKKRIPLIDFDKLRKNKDKPEFAGDNQKILQASFSQANLQNVRSLATGGKTYKIVDAARGLLPEKLFNTSLGRGFKVDGNKISVSGITSSEGGGVSQILNLFKTAKEVKRTQGSAVIDTGPIVGGDIPQLLLRTIEKLRKDPSAKGISIKGSLASNIMNVVDGNLIGKRPLVGSRFSEDEIRGATNSLLEKFTKKDRIKNEEFKSNYVKFQIDLAKGLIPNFSYGFGGFPIGQGAFGSVRAGRGRLSNFVEKTFDGEVFKPGGRFVGRESDFLQQEYIMTKMAAQAGLPILDVVGSLNRSLGRGTLVKQRAKGLKGEDLIDVLNRYKHPGGTISEKIGEALEKKFAAKGIEANDLMYNPGNYSVELPYKEIEKMAAQRSYPGYYNDLIKKLTDNATVLDAGLHRTSDRRFGHYAGGRIPNFATKLPAFDKILGSGLFGTVREGRGKAKGLVQKKVNDSYLHRADDLIETEYKASKVSESFGFPIAKVVGSLDSSLRKKALIKKKVDGMEASRALEYLTMKGVDGGGIFFDIRRELEDSFKRRGIDAYDLHGGNIIFKTSNKELDKLAQKDERTIKTTLFKKLKIVDLGNFTSGKHNFAEGRVPNFNNPALDQAIERELKATGLPKSQIRIESDASLASRLNPMGLGVTNLRDEPRGIGQGISRAKRQGIDPKTHGIAVPNFAKGDSTIKGLRDLPEDIKDRIADAIGVSKTGRNDNRLQTSLSFAPQEAKATNKKILEPVVSKLAQAAKIGASEVDKVFKDFAGDLSKIIPQRLGKFSVKQTVGNREGAERAIGSIKRKFAANPNVESFLGKAKGDPVTILNSLLRQAKDPNQGLPPEFELRKQIQSAAQAPQAIKKLRKDRNTERGIVPYGVGKVENPFAKEIPRLRMPPLESVNDIPSSARRVNREDFIPTISGVPLSQPRNMGPPPTPPIRPPGGFPDDGDEDKRRPVYPNRFEKGILKNQLKKSSLEKALSTNIENLLDSELNKLSKGSQGKPNDFFAGIAPPLSKVPIEGQSRNARTQDIRKFIDKSAASNLNNPAFYSTITNLNKAQTIEGDFMERVQNKIVKEGVGLEKALFDAQREVRELNKIDPTRMIKGMERTVPSLIQFDEQLKASRTAVSQTLKEIKRGEKERSVLLSAEKGPLSRSQREFLQRRELERVKSSFGVNEQQFAALGKKEKKEIENIARRRVAESVIERTDPSDQARVFKDFGINGTPASKPKGSAIGRFIKSDKFTNSAFLASFALSGASGFAGDGTLGKGLQGAGLGASFGLLGGGPGVLIGGLLGGAFGAIKSEINQLAPSLESLDQAFQKVNSTFQKNIEAANQFVRTQSDLKEAIESGASGLKVENLKNTLLDQFSSIKDSDLRNQLLSAGGNSEEQLAIVERSRRIKQQEVSQASLNAIFGSVNEELGSFFGGKAQFNKAIGTPIKNFLSSVFSSESGVGPFNKNARSDLAPVRFLDSFASGKTFSNDQIDRLGGELFNAGGLIDAGTGESEAADKLLASLNEAFDQIETPEGVRKFEEALQSIGVSAEFAKNQFSDTGERIRFLSKILDLSKEAESARRLNDALTGSTIATAKYVKELQRVDSILRIQNEISDLALKNQQALDLQRRRGLVEISSGYLTPSQTSSTLSDIDFDALLSKQDAEFRSSIRKQTDDLRGLLDTNNKFTKEGIKNTILQLRELEENGGSIIPLLESLIAETEETKNFFQKDASETKDKLRDQLIEAYRSTGVLKEIQEYQRRSFEQQKKIEQAVRAQKTLETALGGRDPLDVAKDVYSGKTTIDEIIKPFSSLGKDQYLRRKQERDNSVFSTREDENRLTGLNIKEAISRLEQFKFFENLVGLNDTQKKQLNEARSTVSKAFASRSAEAQIGQLPGLSGVQRDDISNAIRSQNPKKIQSQIDRFKNINPNFTGPETSETVVDILTTLKESLETVFQSQDLADKIGGGSSLNDIVRAAEASDNILKKGLESLRTIFAADQEVKFAESAIATAISEKAKLETEVGLKKEQITGIKSGVTLNNSTDILGRPATGLGLTEDKILKQDKSIQPILQGIRSGEFKTLGDVAKKIDESSTTSRRFGEVKTDISRSGESTIDYLFRTLSGIDGLLNSKDAKAEIGLLENDILDINEKIVDSNIKIVTSQGELTTAIDELKTAIEKKADTEIPSLGGVVSGSTPEIRDPIQPEVRSLRGNYTATSFRDPLPFVRPNLGAQEISSANIALPKTENASNINENTEKTIAELQSIIEVFTGALKTAAEVKVNNVLDIRGQVLSDGSVTDEELERLNAAIIRAFEEIEALRRLAQSKVALPPTSRN